MKADQTKKHQNLPILLNLRIIIHTLLLRFSFTRAYNKVGKKSQLIIDNVIYWFQSREKLLLREFLQYIAIQTKWTEEDSRDCDIAQIFFVTAKI